MKDLQQKYNTYKTPFEESAFEHFKTIQQKSTVGQKIQSWHIAVVILLLSIPTIFFIHALMSSKDTIVQDVPTDIRQEEKQDAILEISNVNETVKYDNETDIKEVKSAITETILNDKIANNTTHLTKPQKEISNITPTKQQDVISDIRNDIIPANQYIIIQNNNTPSEKTGLISYQNPIITIQKTIDITQPENNIQITQKKQYKSQSVASKTPLLTHEDVQDFELSPILNPVSPSAPNKTWAYYRNHLKLSYNYADFYGNSVLGVIPGYKNPSYLIQGEYFRELNKIVSVGSSVGYARGVKSGAAQDSLSNYENITFAHLNLYFFLVNSEKHQLYFKAGSGVTNTKRQYVSYMPPPQDTIIQGSRYTNLTNPGLLLEFSYNYHFTDRWFIGANAGIIAHNDGATYGGLSLGYSF